MSNLHDKDPFDRITELDVKDAAPDLKLLCNTDASK